MTTTRYRYLLQQKIEETFSKKFIIQKAVDDLLTCESIVAKLNKGVEILYSWFNEEHGIDKSLRLLALQQLDVNELVEHTVALVALHCSKPMKLVSIASMCIGHLKMADKVDAIQTMAEVIAMLSDTDLFDCKKTKDGWVVLSRIGLDEEVLRYAYNAFYLPPMIIKPRTVRHNRDSGYITQRGESLILGYYENHHDDDICLDAINTLNSNEYELDTDLISSLSEDPLEITIEKLQENAAAKDKYLSRFDAEKKLKQILDTWDDYQEECYKIQTLMLYHGNKFYLQNKVDKRGRIYTSGYHISPQGSSFKKAMINLANKEIVTGLDTW